MYKDLFQKSNKVLTSTHATMDTSGTEPKKRKSTQDTPKNEYIVVNVVNTVEPSEPQSIHLAFNIGEEMSFDCKFPAILARLCKNSHLSEKTDKLRFKKVFTGVKTKSNDQDFVLMNVMGDGEEGWDYAYTDAKGEKINGEDLVDDIAQMMTTIDEHGYATAREMLNEHPDGACLLHRDCVWVRVDVTEC